MKKLVLLSIHIYQLLISPLLRQVLGTKSICRFTPSCSIYATMCINRYGVIKGVALSIKRFFACQPFIKIYGKHY